MTKSNRNMRIDVKVSADERESYHRASEIVPSDDPSNVSNLVRTASNVMAQNIIDIAGGKATIDQALEAYQAALLQLLPGDVLAKIMTGKGQ